ncbi:ferredoxin [Cryptosporangium sp. NPDC051539]|uniref:ferredoxin n=1 Tax=Cryptosporangium sp. NPDC051539 TaxID=3363962 RepID=UPI0037B752C1
MKVLVEQDKCAANGLCAMEAPEEFPLDADGFVSVDGALELPTAQRDAVLRAAAACPERVISLVGPENPFPVSGPGGL